jgi:hypothetical protein
VKNNRRILMPKKLNASERVIAAAKGVSGATLTAWGAFWHSAANTATFGLYNKSSTGESSKEILRCTTKYSIGSMREAITGEEDEDKGHFLYD